MFRLLFSVPDEGHPASSFQKGRDKIGKVPPQLVHDLECFPHVGRVDSDLPLVLLLIPGLHLGLGARFDAMNGKWEGKERITC